MADPTDLIRGDRATQAATLLALNVSNPAYLASLITAASQLIRHACARDFLLTTYSEYYDGGIYKGVPLSLRQYPVTQISRIAGTPTSALLVQNSGATVQRATVETQAGGNVKLAWVASGVAASATLLATTYPTLGAMATAIGAAGNGFSASVTSAANINLALYPSADLRPLQGAATTLGGGCYLEAYLEDVLPWGNSLRGFDGWGDGCGSGTGWRLDSNGSTGRLYGVFPRGQQNIRIDYTAGYATVPQPVQEACVHLVQWLFQQSQSNSAVKSAKLGNTSFENSQLRLWPPTIMALLGPYVAHDRVVNR